jgi:hypothetical protein
VEIRRVLCSTNAIESLNARYRRAIKARGHFPSEQSGAEVPVSRHPIPGPDRTRQGTMGDALEAGVERVLDHLRGPLPGRGDLLTEDAVNTVSEIDPARVAVSNLPSDDAVMSGEDEHCDAGGGGVAGGVAWALLRCGSAKMPASPAPADALQSQG